MILHKLPPIQNVGANLTATLPNIPLGMTYKGIVLKRGGTTFTNPQLSNIRLSLDGKRIWDITGAHKLTQNSYSGFNMFDYIMSHIHVENTAASYTQNANTASPSAYSSQYDLIAFADFNARTIGGESLGALDSSVGYRSFQMEVDIGAATAPTLEAWAILGPEKATDDPNRFTFRAILKRIESLSASGEYNVNVPIGSREGALLHRVYFHNTNGTKLQVTKDGLFLQQEGEISLVNFMQTIRRRITQSGLIVYDPVVNDNISEPISTLRIDGNPANFEWRLTVSASDTVTIYTSLFSNLNNL